jgi:23S rRNA (adenine2503-C2)-methyltransferase
MKKMLLGMDVNELRKLMEREGAPAYRGSQLAEWLYRKGAREFDDMSNIQAALRAGLARKYVIGKPETAAIQESKDGTFKLLLEMGDGARVETVGLPYADRFSCCVSTQVGCPVGCVFCASGRGGLVRSLEPGEIAGQVLTVNEAVESGAVSVNSKKQKVDHVVVMGMGEPLLNYDSTLKAVSLLNREIGIGARSITLSTVGIVPEILKLAEEKLQITLDVSLHAPDDKLRKRIIPNMSRWSIAEILDACRRYVDKTGRRVTFEYCLLDGINDGTAEARKLAEIIRGMNCHVNLIRFNPVTDLPFRSPATAKVREFRGILESAGIQITRRMQRGSDISAACGQLRRLVKEST